MSKMSSKSPKRKIAEEGRTFQERWTDEYFFVASDSKAVCLICKESVAVFKTYNLRRHYVARHAAKFGAYQGVCRKDKIAELKRNLLPPQNFKKTVKSDYIKASYVVANLMAKRSKPYCDGGFIKECMESVADVICPDKKKDFSKISLSHQTIARRVNDIGASIENVLKSRAACFKFYSLAIDESPDIAQVAIFIRGVDEEYNITEEMAALVPLKGATGALDLYEAVKNTLQRFSLSVGNLSGVVTDGAPATIGQRDALLKLLEGDAIAAQNFHLMKYHCIVRPEDVCAKASNMANVVQVVNKAVSFIRSNHSQFQDFLKVLGSHYGGVVFSEVQRLSRGQTLARFYDLQNEIKLFMESKGKSVAELGDPYWSADLAFLVDLTAHFNELNQGLRGESQLITAMFQAITAFERKLRLWQSQLKANNCTHFATLAKHPPLNAAKYATFLSDLEQEFENRFKDFRKNEPSFAVFSTPFSVDINFLLPSFQMECIDLQSDIQLKEKFDHFPLMDFYKVSLPRRKYPSLHNHALFMASLFGSTYICERLFSRRTKTRSKISDEQLEKSMRIATTSIEVNLDALAAQKRRPTSHNVQPPTVNPSFNSISAS